MIDSTFTPDPSPVPLFCPGCLKSEAGLASVALAEKRQAAADDIVDWCPQCGMEYPRVEGIHCLPPDLAAFRSEQAFALEPGWLPANEDAVDAAVRAASHIDPGTELFRETVLPAIYGLAHFPETAADPLLCAELASNSHTIDTLTGWLDRHTIPAGAPARCGLEVGCGVGRLLHALAPRLPDGAVGLDLRLSMLRVAQRLSRTGEVYLPFRTEGRRFEPVRIAASTDGHGLRHFVQADVTALPFAPGTFPLIATMSLIDVVPAPLRMLRDLDALLAPGGLLLIATPYHWQPHTTPPENWWSTGDSTGPSTLRIALMGGHPALPRLNYDILESIPDLPWGLPGHRRFVYRYFLDGLLARKRR